MKKTVLNNLHIEFGGKMVEFAGYSMPIQYGDGMLKEHEWVRNGNVGLFDVSHMGQFIIEGDCVDKFLSKITPTNFTEIVDNLAKYTVLTNEAGGIIDDLIITKINNQKFFIVLNAACKEKDFAWISKNKPVNVKFVELVDRALIAIQGDEAENALNKFIKNANLADLKYMNLGVYQTTYDTEVFISRTGYTGEDGFEISIKNEFAQKFMREICENPKVKPIGLGARDTLRLEMGYPLYGNDLDEQTSPIEAKIGWVVSKNHEDFFGSKRILDEKTNGTKKTRLGVRLLDKGVLRSGTEIFKDGKKVGVLTSGGFSPILKQSIGQGYFNSSEVKSGDKVHAIIREKEFSAVLESFVFVKPKTKSSK